MPPIVSQNLRHNDGQNRGFNIADFRALRNQLGILRNHDFIMEIPFPDVLVRTGSRVQVERNLEFVCDNTNFPTTALTTYKVARYSYGAMESKPTYPVFEDLQCTFVTDSYTMIWRFFHDWLRATVNYRFGPNQIATPEQQMEVYEISYKQEYAVDMFLYIYDQFGQNVRKVAFRQAYPIVVGGVPLSWAAGNQFVRVPVTFTFFDWGEEATIFTPVNTSPGPGPTPIK